MAEAVRKHSLGVAVVNPTLGLDLEPLSKSALGIALSFWSELK